MTRITMGGSTIVGAFLQEALQLATPWPWKLWTAALGLAELLYGSIPLRQYYGSIPLRLPLPDELHGGRAGGPAQAGQRVGQPGDSRGFWACHCQVERLPFREFSFVCKGELMDWPSPPAPSHPNIWSLVFLQSAKMKTWATWPCSRL